MQEVEEESSKIAMSCNISEGCIVNCAVSIVSHTRASCYGNRALREAHSERQSPFRLVMHTMHVLLQMMYKRHHQVTGALTCKYDLIEGQVVHIAQQQSVTEHELTY